MVKCVCNLITLLLYFMKREENSYSDPRSLVSFCWASMAHSSRKDVPLRLMGMILSPEVGGAQCNPTIYHSQF